MREFYLFRQEVVKDQTGRLKGRQDKTEEKIDAWQVAEECVIIHYLEKVRDKNKIGVSGVNLQKCISFHLFVTQHIERYQLSEDWILSYGDAKSKS